MEVRVLVPGRPADEGEDEGGGEEGGPQAEPGGGLERPQQGFPLGRVGRLR